jgi:FkbM family methyltransferase
MIGIRDLTALVCGGPGGSRAGWKWMVRQMAIACSCVAWIVSAADARMVIGHSIDDRHLRPRRDGALARLIRTGDTVVDAGLCWLHDDARRLAVGLRAVTSWEPHPELFKVLKRNIADVSADHRIARITLRNAALAGTRGTAELAIPDDAPTNDAMCYLARAERPSTRSIPVAVETIDDVLGVTPVAVMKLDGGCGADRALAGASAGLAAGRIRHIVFEDHTGSASDVVKLLRSLGYEIFAIGWSLRGPILGPADGRRLIGAYEAPSYLATIAPGEVRDRFSKPGWTTLSRRFARGRRRP